MKTPASSTARKRREAKPAPAPEQSPLIDPAPAADEPLAFDDDGLKRVQDIIRNARATWFALLGALVFASVTLAGVKDISFFVNTVETKLPIVGISVPVVSFFWAGSLLTAALYAYFHLYLELLWQALGDFPARDKSGALLADRIEPWIVADTALRFRDWLRGDTGDKSASRKRAMPWISGFVSLGLVWVFGLAVIFWFWWRSMPAHEPLLTLFLGVVLWVTVFVFGSSLAGAWTHLKFENHEAQRAVQWRWSLPLVFMAIFALTFVRTAEGGWFLASADLREAVFTEKPKDWQGKEIAETEFRVRWCRERGEPKCANPLALEHRLFSDKREEESFRKAWKERWAAQLLAFPKPDLRHVDFRRADLSAASLEGAGLSLTNLEGANLRGANIERANLRGASLRGANLRDAIVEGADLTRATLEGANLVGANLEGAILFATMLEGANLRNAYLKGADLSYARLQSADLNGANLESAALRGASAELADLRTANLRGADLTRASLKSAKLSGAMLQDAVLPQASLDGADLSGARLESANIQAANLNAASLRGARLDGADLFGANLKGADFSEASLKDADLSETNLQGADFSLAILEGTDLSESNLQDAILVGASLESADFSEANLAGSNLSGTRLFGTPAMKLELYFADRNTSLTGSAFRFANIVTQNIALLEGFHTTFGDESVDSPPNTVRPCQWGRSSEDPFDDKRFFGRWRGWLEDQRIDLFSMPRNLLEYPAIPPPPECRRRRFEKD